MHWVALPLNTNKRIDIDMNKREGRQHASYVHQFSVIVAKMIVVIMMVIIMKYIAQPTGQSVSQ